MPEFDVEVHPIDRRSRFTIEWEALDANAIVEELNRVHGVDVICDDGSIEFYPLATLRKISIKESA